MRLMVVASGAFLSLVCLSIYFPLFVGLSRSLSLSSLSMDFCVAHELERLPRSSSSSIRRPLVSTLLSVLLLLPLLCPRCPALERPLLRVLYFFSLDLSLFRLSFSLEVRAESKGFTVCGATPQDAFLLRFLLFVGFAVRLKKSCRHLRDMSTRQRRLRGEEGV